MTTRKSTKVKAAKLTKAAAPTEPNNALKVRKATEETEALATAKAILSPDFRHGMVVSRLMAPQMGSAGSGPGLGDYGDAIGQNGDAAAKGDLAFASRMLAAQAVTLDTIFGEMARRMAINMGEYLGATETYGRIAMKAQAQSRATLEALAKLHQPREQTVRHVHVNEGGQAIVADQFHHHAGGQENGPICDQPHEQGSCSPALPSPNPFGNGVPIACNEGQEAVPVARRTIDGSA